MHSQDNHRTTSGQASEPEKLDAGQGQRRRARLLTESYNYTYNFPYRDIADRLMERALFLRPKEGDFINELRHQRVSLTPRQANWLHGICKRLGVDDDAIR